MLVKPVKRDDFFTLCDEAPHIDVLPLLKPSSLFAVVCAASEGFTSREQSKDMCCPILAQDVAQCPVCSCPILPQHVAQMYFSVIVAAYSLRCLPKTVCHNVFGISSEPVGWCLRLWTVFVQCMAGIWRFFCFYYGFVVPACIALSGIIGQYKSLHMFEHSIYNRSVVENSICCFIFSDVELHF